MGTSNSNMIVKEGCPHTHADPSNKEEIDNLYMYEPAMCKIIYKEKNGQEGYGQDFFVKLMPIFL